MTEETSPAPISDSIKEAKEKWDSWADLFVEIHVTTQLSKVEKNMSAEAKAEFMERLNSLDHGLMHGGEKYVFTADRFDEVIEIMESSGTIYPNAQARESWRASGPAGGVENGTIKALNQEVLKQFKKIYSDPETVWKTVATDEARQQVFNSKFQSDASSTGWDGGPAYIDPTNFALYISAIALAGQFGTNGAVGAWEYPGPKFMTMLPGPFGNKKWPQYLPYETVEMEVSSGGNRPAGYKSWGWRPTARIAQEGAEHFIPGVTATAAISAFQKEASNKSLSDLASNFSPAGPLFTDLPPSLYGNPATFYYRIGKFNNPPPRGIPAPWNEDWAIETNEFLNRIARNYPKKIEQAFLPLLQKLMENDPDIEINPNIGDEPDGSEYAEGGPPPPSYLQSPSDLAPVDLQCFLFENIRLLTDRAQEARDPNKGGEAFQHFSMLNGGKGTPGNLISYLQAGDDSAGAAFLNICPDVYALLTPFMKFYRVDYKDDDKLKPYKETRIPFPNFINPSDIENITKFKWGRFRGAGIKSFSWKLDGVQPAEVENNISANLNIYFQTLQDMFSLNWNGGRAQAGIPNQAGYLDLIIGSGTSFRGEGEQIDSSALGESSACDAINERYKGENFRIKAVVGWSVPEGFKEACAAMGVDSIQANSLIEAIKKAKTALYLQIVSHNVTFNEDGSVDLSIDYQAALSGILRAPSADLFIGKDVYTLETEDIKTKIAQERKRLPRGTESSPKLEELLKKKASLSSRNRAAKYKKFLAGLYNSGRVYVMPIGPDMWQSGLLRDMGVDERARESIKRITNQLNPDSDPAISGRPFPANQINMDGINSLADHQAARNADEPGDDAETEVEKVNRHFFEQFLLSASPAYRQNLIQIPFIYFGDLVDWILDELSHVSDNSFNFYMAETELLDPLRAHQVQEIQLSCPNMPGELIWEELENLDPMRFGNLLREATGNEVMLRTNIAHIPISIKYFQEWFVNNVVRPQREIYPLLKFMKDMCSGIIGKAFGNICFNKSLPTQVKFDTSIFTQAGTRRLGEQFGQIDRDTFKKNIDEGRKVAARSADAAASSPALVLYSVDSKPAAEGKRGEDHAQGIYHYAMGARCGLAKKISFNRVDQPYLREARIAKVGALGAEQLRELYTVEIDMVGNTLHKNGQYLYVEPITIGSGDFEYGKDKRSHNHVRSPTRNLAQRLGFGGYYLITSVASSISDAGFDVQVSALQEGIKFSSGTTGNEFRTVSGNDYIYTGAGVPPTIL